VNSSSCKTDILSLVINLTQGGKLKIIKSDETQNIEWVINFNSREPACKIGLKIILIHEK
jgi:hypothetical protein